jgi:hypothetical protein
VETAGATLALRGAWHGGMNPAGSVAEALDRALLLPGALAVALGEVSRPQPLAWAHAPQVPESLALDGARHCAGLAAAFRQDGEDMDELVVTGPTRVQLLQARPLPAGGSAYLHLSLARSLANIALASMALRLLVNDLPRLLAGEPAGLPRRAQRFRAANPSRPVPADAPSIALLRLVAERLRMI